MKVICVILSLGGITRSLPKANTAVAVMEVVSGVVVVIVVMVVVRVVVFVGLGIIGDDEDYGGGW